MIDHHIPAKQGLFINIESAYGYFELPQDLWQKEEDAEGNTIEKCLYNGMKGVFDSIKKRITTESVAERSAFNCKLKRKSIVRRIGTTIASCLI